MTEHTIRSVGCGLAMVGMGAVFLLTPPLDGWLPAGMRALCLLIVLSILLVFLAGVTFAMIFLFEKTLYPCHRDVDESACKNAGWFLVAWIMQTATGYLILMFCKDFAELLKEVVS